MSGYDTAQFSTAPFFLNLVSHLSLLSGLSFIGTDPQHQGKGAASPLLQWGLDRSTAENIPVALEGTADAARFYEKFGFRAEERISMWLDGVGQNGASVFYEEVCFVFRPQSTTIAG